MEKSVKKQGIFLYQYWWTCFWDSRLHAYRYLDSR